MFPPISAPLRALPKSFYIQLMFDLVMKIAFVFGSDADVHLDLGMQLLMKGQLNEALSHYHLAVESDPQNYLTYFKRSTVYQAMGRYRLALDDLSECLKLNPDFLPARLQKGIVLFRQGNLDDAAQEFEWVLHHDPNHVEAHQYYSQIEPLKSEMNVANQLMQYRRYHDAIQVLTKLIQEFYWSYELKEMRAECYEQIGDIVSAISDLRALTKMKSDNTKGYLRLSRLHYSIGEPDESLAAIRECLKLDPDHKECHDHYKKVKKLAALYKKATELSSEGNYQGCIDKLKSALEVETKAPNVILLFKTKLCHCFNMNKQAMEAVRVCTEAIEMNPNDPHLYCDRADAHIYLDNFDDATIDYKKATQLDGQSTRARDGLQKAERLKKQSKKRDYYKILGVARNANKREIVKAYRKLASKWHPDNYKEGDEKKIAEQKFIDIAAAKEVLTDPEKRQKFDNGEDPLDHEQQNGNGFHPFTRGGTFDPFGSGNGGYTFRFTF